MSDLLSNGAANNKHVCPNCILCADSNTLITEYYVAGGHTARASCVCRTSAICVSNDGAVIHSSVVTGGSCGVDGALTSKLVFAANIHVSS